MHLIPSRTIIPHLLTLLALLLSITSFTTGHQVLTGPRSWSSLLRKAFDIGRTAKWNEFIEEKSGHNPFASDPSFAGKNDTNNSSQASSSSTSTSAFRKSNQQNLIDETKDPDSPYYIAMISSNIGGGHSAASVAHSTGNNNRNNSSSGISSYMTGSSLGGNSKTKDNSNGMSGAFQYSATGGGGSANSGLVSKLFSYAFAPSTPSRVMQTTKRPLVTYINVSNLEEHEQVIENSVSKIGSSSEMTGPSGPTLSLLNSDHTSTGGAILHQHDHTVSSSSASKRRLPECATQQVCSAHYVKSNHTQRLCECPQDFKWNCEEPSSSSLGETTHTIDLTRKQEYKTQRNNLEAYTQVKMCENLKSIKPCKTPTDWTIMALQSERTGKAHYVVVCKCPDEASFEGPFTHKHPPYARFPGIRVYGMLCNQGVRKSKDPKALEIDEKSEQFPEFPWELAYAVINATTTHGFW